jgi:hypothetical protein
MYPLTNLDCSKAKNFGNVQTSLVILQCAADELFKLRRLISEYFEHDIETLWSLHKTEVISLTALWMVGSFNRYDVHNEKSIPLPSTFVHFSLRHS